MEHNNHNYLSMAKFQEKCSWELDLLTYGDEDGHLIIPNSDNIQHLQPFQVKKFWNPILVNYPDNLPNRIFCRTELLQSLEGILDQLKIDKYILYTGHSDIIIDDRFMSVLDNPRLIKMYSHSMQIEHPKLSYIPVGPRFQNSNGLEAMDKLIHNPQPKVDSYYVRFSIGTNPSDRNKCLHYCDKPLSPRTSSYAEYLSEVQKHRFMLVPKGNNDRLLPDKIEAYVDNHQFWECLYLKTIPVVVESVLIKQAQQFFPFVVLKDWSEFDPDMFTPELYDKLWAQYPNIENDLKFDYFFEHYCT